MKGNDLQLPTHLVIPLGLIVTELVTNAAKYGAQKVSVSLMVDASCKCSLSVTDDGSGLPANFEPAATRGLGLKVVSALVLRLNGHLLFGTPQGTSERGANFTVLFDVG